MTKRQRTMVSLAGPFANVVLAVALLASPPLFFDPDHVVFWGGVAFLGFLQVTAVLLNLLPIPGLDGYGALEPHLSPDTQRQLEPVKQWGFLILLLPAVRPRCSTSGSSRSVLWFVDLFGVPGGPGRHRQQLTRFWSAWF